ncbi:cold shock domain-containing protein [Aerococcus agrisoli]|uniref:Cold shock domain-containing protein n=1 Tax=Aerococcus agrisoli TaxID=2487350 RepID=A0A3N4GG40_9LACT|nr:cold shock domain-containing protein [Aerococcus agrisoli]RPA60818.1 cold shock domain-containing protein [Aerococcus agrisoli]
MAYYGIVKTFNEKEGFGFIELPDFPEEDDIFVHFSALLHLEQSSLTVGQKVHFEIAEGKRGPQAVNISLG